MATFYSSVPSLYGDSRSENLAEKRYYDSTFKWCHGVKHERHIAADVPGEALAAKQRPNHSHLHVLANPPSKARTDARSGRLSRRADAQYSARVDKTLSRSLLDLAGPSCSESKSPIQDTYLYSFDASSSPGQDTALGALVDKALGAWEDRKVFEQVRREWELVDADDADTERPAATSSRRRKRAKGKSLCLGATADARVDGFGANDEDWEKL